MIDIHNHIVFGVDDGAETIDEAISMVKLAKEQGFTDIIATPHLISGRYVKSRESISKRLLELQAQLNAEGVNINLYQGREVSFYADILQEIPKLKTETLNGSRYLLLELPFIGLPKQLNSYIYELILGGIVPILAHVERAIHSDDDFEMIKTCIQEGALVQCNVNSILGDFGSKSQRYFEKLLKSNMVHFISSDAHRATGKRTYDILAGLEKIKTLVLPRTFELISYSHALAVIENRAILAGMIHEQTIVRKKLFGIF